MCDKKSAAESERDPSVRAITVSEAILVNLLPTNKIGRFCNRYADLL
jgi:hypothetical protein